MLKKVIFLDYERVFPAISEILKVAGVKEPSEEEGITDRGNFLTKTLTRATRDLRAEKISESNLSASLINDLGVSKQGASGIIEGIKEKLIPLTEIVEIDENHIPPTEDFVDGAIKEAGAEELEVGNETPEEIEPIENNNIGKPSPTINDKKISESFPLNKNPDIDKKTPKTPDQYREPLK